MQPPDDSSTDSGMYTDHADVPQLPNWIRMPEIDENSCFGDASVILGAINHDAVYRLCDGDINASNGSETHSWQ